MSRPGNVLKPVVNDTAVVSSEGPAADSLRPRIPLPSIPGLRGATAQGVLRDKKVGKETYSLSERGSIRDLPDQKRCH